MTLQHICFNIYASITQINVPIHAVWSVFSEFSVDSQAVKASIGEQLNTDQKNDLTLVMLNKLRCNAHF